MKSLLAGVPDRQAHVWYCATEVLPEHTVTDALAVLSEEERERHDRFLFWPTRRDYAIAHALLRTTLSRYHKREPREWRFETLPGGKPVLASNEEASCSFSLSHARGLVACAVSNGPAVGVDVEVVGRNINPTPLAAHYFSQSEAAALSECGDDLRLARFVELWTLKEAYLKAVGTGLASSLSTFSLDLGIPHQVHLALSGSVSPEREWQFAMFKPMPSHELAIAVRSEPGHGQRIFAMNSVEPELMLLATRASVES